MRNSQGVKQWSQFNQKYSRLQLHCEAYDTWHNELQNSNQTIQCLVVKCDFEIVQSEMFFLRLFSVNPASYRLMQR